MRRKASTTLETSLGSRSEGPHAPSSPDATSSDTIRLVLAGHHPLTLCGLTQVFQKEDDCRVIDTCTDGDSVVDVVRRHRPDILILDADLPRNGAFSAIRRVRRERLPTHVVVLASASDDDHIVNAVRLGARAVVLKEMPPEAFVTCVRKVRSGEQWLAGHAVDRLVSKLYDGRASLPDVARNLTPREAEIARLAIEGVSTREIAARLAVKQGTVKIHLHSIYDKLSVAGRLGLMLFARRHGLG